MWLKQDSVTTWKRGIQRETRGRFGREEIWVYLWLILVDVWQKTTKFCTAIILQSKKKKSRSLLPVFAKAVAPALNIFFLTVYIYYRTQINCHFLRKPSLNLINITSWHFIQFLLSTDIIVTSQVVLVVKNLPANARDTGDNGSIPGSWGRSPGGWRGNPLQYSCLENPMDRGVRWAIIHRVAKSRTWLKRLSTHSIHSCNYL